MSVTIAFSQRPLTKRSLAAEPGHDRRRKGRAGPTEGEYDTEPLVQHVADGSLLAEQHK